MKVQRLVSLWICLGLPCVAGTQPKAAVTEYPAHIELPQLALGAEDMVRSFALDGRVYVAEDYLVVEVALFPARGTRPLVRVSDFQLHLNGSKQGLLAQTPGMVAASLKYSDWESKPTLIGEASAGNAGVIINRPQGSQRFPMDTRQERSRLPRPPQVSMDRQVEPTDQRTAAELVVEAALQEGEAASPISGYLYFPYKGKTKKIRSMALGYLHRGEWISLPLR